MFTGALILVCLTPPFDTFCVEDARLTLLNPGCDLGVGVFWLIFCALCVRFILEPDESTLCDRSFAALSIVPVRDFALGTVGVLKVTEFSLFPLGPPLAAAAFRRSCDARLS